MNYAPNKGKTWTRDDDAVLLALSAQGWSWRAMAKYFGRTTMAVANRLTTVHRMRKVQEQGVG